MLGGEVLAPRTRRRGGHCLSVSDVGVVKESRSSLLDVLSLDGRVLLLLVIEVRARNDLLGGGATSLLVGLWRGLLGILIGTLAALLGGSGLVGGTLAVIVLALKLL